MEDTNDKIRRNLLALSALILVLWWLDVKDTELLKRILGDIGKDVALWKVRVGSIVLLGYFLLRYRFSENFTSFLIEKRKDWGNFTEIYCNKFLVSALKKYIYKNKPQSVFSNLSDKTKKYIAEVRAAHKDSYFKITNSELNPSYTKGEWGGVINFGLSVSYGKTYGEQSNNNEEITFEIKGFNKWVICAKCFIVLLAYSKTSIEYFLPMLLGGLALILTVYRLLFC